MWQFIIYGKQNSNSPEFEWGGGWEGGEDGCKPFRWATFYCRSWNLAENAKGESFTEQRRVCELPGSRTRSCFCISAPRSERAASRAAAGGRCGIAAPGRAEEGPEIPAAPEPGGCGGGVGASALRGCQGGQRGGLPAQILLLCGNFPLERLLHFLTRRLMEGGRGKGRSAGISSLVSKQACRAESLAALPALMLCPELSQRSGPALGTRGARSPHAATAGC